MNLIVSCLRGTIIAPKGRKLITADYAAIEARCVLWLAGATGALKVFEPDENGKPGDIYLDMASGIFGRKITKANARTITTDGKTERDFGKVAILGLGYGMGWIKFLLTLRDYKIYLTRAEVKQMMGMARLQKYEEIVRRKLYPMMADFVGKKEAEKKFAAAQREAKVEVRRLQDGREDPKTIMHELALCKYTVEVYRDRYEEVPAMWKAQEAAAIEALRTRRPVKCGKVTWFVQGRFLKCRLPSGRCLHYCDATLKMAKTSWGESRPSIRFMGKDQKTKQWTRQGTYGGKLTENITQASARDIMALAMIGLDDSILYELLITVHDEAVAEVDDGREVPREFEEIMTRMPQAFHGCPITAESKVYGRYRK
jgi:DNA polymerase